jgi:hypothetical protein
VLPVELDFTANDNVPGVELKNTVLLSPVAANFPPSLPLHAKVVE